jgi:hypothetical protein
LGVDENFRGCVSPHVRDRMNADAAREGAGVIRRSDGGAFWRSTSASETAQKLQIAAFDQRDRIMDEAIGFSAGVQILPLDRGKLGVVGGEHFGRDVARATAGVVNVESVEKQLAGAGALFVEL